MTGSTSPDSLFYTAEPCFCSCLIPSTDDRPALETVELVRQEQALVKLLQTSSESADDTSCRLVCGARTRLADNGMTLIAETNGYPLLSRKTRDNKEEITVSIVPLLFVTDDKMEALVTLYPPVSGCPALDGETLLAILRESGIKFGLNTALLQDLINRCSSEQQILTKETAARGLLPLHGRDSFLRFEIEIGPFPGKILGNGRIDFRERKMFVGIQKGETIATRIPPTSGSPGITVFGDELPQRQGKELKVGVSGDAEFDEETGIVKALQSGILSMVNENSITVCAKQLIQGDVDFGTGNIESRDALEINGSILPGFKVNTRGDLLVGGSIRSAFVRCQGNLIIQEGIMGDSGQIRVRGDADFKFIEQGKIRCGGRAIIRKQTYYSKILASGEILAHESSIVIGGMLLSGESMSLGTVGSPNAPPALLAAGISPERYLEYLKIRSHLQEKEEALHLWLQRHGQKAEDPGRESLEEAVSALKQTIHDLNLSPGKAEDSPETHRQLLAAVTIKVHKTLYAGTRIQIGDQSLEISSDLGAVSFRRGRDESLVQSPL